MLSQQKQTRAFFELSNYDRVPEAWCLGCPQYRNEIFDNHFAVANPWPRSVPLRIPVRRVLKHLPGEPQQYSQSPLGTPVVTKALALAMASLAGEQVQLVPVRVRRLRLQIINVLQVVKCLDEKLTEFNRWTRRQMKHQPNLVGTYAGISHRVLAAAKIPKDVHIFRLEGARYTLIVSREMKKAMIEAGCQGATFTRELLS